MNLLQLLPNILPFRNKALKEAPLIVYDKLKLDNSATAKLPALGSDILFQLDQDAAFSIKVINTEEDLKEASIPVLFDENEAASFFTGQSLLSYNLLGKLRSEGNLEGGDIGKLNLSAGQTAELSKITPHQNHITINDALAKDLINFTEIFSASEQASFPDSLRPHEAFAYAFSGDLNFEISVNLLKLLSVAFAPVFSLTPGPKVPLSIDTSLQIGFKATRKDSFKVLIGKKSNSKFRLVLQKNKEKQKDFSISANLTLQLQESDERMLTGILDDYFEKYLGKPFNEIERILDQAEELREDSFLVHLADKIAFDGTGVEQLREHYNGYKQKISDAKANVLKIATSSISAGIDYEYRKVESSGVLLNAELSEEVLAKEIKNIVKLNINPLIGKAKKGIPGIEIITYFKEKGLTIEDRLSIGISLGNWALKSASERIWQYDEKNTGLEGLREIKLAFLDKKTVTIFGEEASIKASLDAETPQPDSSLRYNQLDCAFTLISKKTDKRVHQWDKRDLHRFLQTALTWHILDEKELNEFFETIWDQLLKNKNIEYECKIHIPPAIFAETIKAISLNASIEAITDAMAVGILPNKADDRSMLISARKEFYKPLIADALSGRDIRNTLEHPIYTEKYRQWRNHELNRIENQNQSGTDSFMGISNNQAFRHFQQLISGINLMNDRLQNSKVIEEDLTDSVLHFFFDAFHNIVKDTSGYSQRWLGYYIMQSLTTQSPETSKSIVNTLTVLYPGENDKKEALIIGG